MEWRRKDLRRKSTLSENQLWQHIRNKQLGFRFKRQYSVSNFVVDFYCHQAKLAVEIDGDIHLLPSNRKYDDFRTQYLLALGIREIRFTNKDVENNLKNVLSEIINCFPSPEIRRGTEGEV